MHRKTSQIRILFVVFTFFFAATCGVMAQGTRESEDDVLITFTPEPDTLGPGAAGTLLIRFSPRKGFHVNAVPAMSIALDSLSGAGLRDSLELRQDTATGFLDSRSPVRQPFALKKNLNPGNVRVGGTLTYYYCSDTEGWCRREKKSFTVPVTVK